MCLEDAMIRFLKTEPCEVAMQNAQDHTENALRKPHGKLRAFMCKYIRRFAEKMFRQEVVSPPHADESGLRRARCIAGNIATGISRADDKHTLAFEFIRRAVGDGMAHLAREGAGILRHDRMPVRSIRTDKRRIVFRFAG